MNKVPYFYEIDSSGIHDGVVLLDVEGTLLSEAGLGSEAFATPERLLSKETISAIGALAKSNTVFLCSNSPNVSSRRRLAAALGNVTFHETKFSKPDRAAVADILPTDGRPVFVIGDSFLTDGLLALAIGAPCLRVGTMQSANDTLSLKVSRAVNDFLWRVFGFLVRSVNPAAPISFLTHPPYSITRPMDLLSNYAADQFRHHGDYEVQSIVRNLGQGLSALNAQYQVDPLEQALGSVVCVLHGADTLRYALEQKRRGFIKKVFAGSNIVAAPADEGNIIKDPLIDRVILPSEWVKRWWLSYDQLFDAKASVWASGVEDRGSGRDNKGICLVYSKNADEKVFQKIIEILWTYKLPIVVSHFGKFNHEEYHRLLKKAKMAVYLSEFEPDGAALRETWMADIPTLVWSRGFLEHQGRRFDDPEVGAPYMRPECGMIFTGDGDFERKLIEFLERYDSFAPRQYAAAHFASAIAARKYLDIIESG